MKKLLLLGSFVAILASCDSDTGQLVGVQGRGEWYMDDPYGMLYIGMGSFNMGPSDEDVPYKHDTKSKTVSIQAFYIDQTEISNNEYRQFVYHVRDSIARRLLVETGNFDEDLRIEEDVFLEINPIYKGDNTPYWDPTVDNSYKIKYESSEDDYREAIQPMYLPEDERIYRRKEIDARKLNFEYYWLDVKTAARYNKEHRWQPEKAPHANDLPIRQGNQYLTGKGSYTVKGRSGIDRSVFIIKDVINVYPDTLAWVHDFTYSFNEPMTNMYFWHLAYDDYPVVGLTWQQCNAFCIWRTQLFNGWRYSRDMLYVNDFRLPTESEWEYAARGNLDLSPYPWGGPYIRNSRGCFLGNFKPMRGSYIDDGGFHTVKIFSYNPNDYGLYCMAGNASEWTSNAYDESAYDFSHDLNPDYLYDAQENELPVMKRKVIRSGSWKDIGYYLETSTRTYEYQDTAKCYIGFRCVMTYLGRSKGDEGNVKGEGF